LATYGHSLTPAFARTPGGNEIRARRGKSVRTAIWGPGYRFLVFREMKSSLRRSRAIVQALFGATAVTASLVVLAPAAQAITIPVACSENALVAAVNLANSTPISDTLVLAGGCTHGMTTSHGGPAPVITTPIEMIGPATVTNASPLGLGLFRIAEVDPTGSVTLTTEVAFARSNVLGDGGAPSPARGRRRVRQATGEVVCGRVVWRDHMS
jgi:hypothetical protein